MSLSPKELNRVKVHLDEGKSVEDIILEREELKDDYYRLNEEKNKYVKNFSRLKRRANIQLLIAASFIIVVVSSFYIKYVMTPNVQSTFDEYYSLYSKGRNINSGIQAYLDEDYQQAIVILKADSNLIVDARWFKVYALIEESEYKAASDILGKIENSEDAEWLNGLCLLASENMYLARKTLEQIYTGQGAYSIPARKILKDHYTKY